MRCKIGVKLGKVLESELYSYPNKATIVKTKILFDSRKTLQLGVYLDGVKDGITWVDFKYEKIHLFCFNYGIIGHSKDLCTQARKKNPWNPMLNNLSDLGSDLQNLGEKSSTKRKKIIAGTIWCPLAMDLSALYLKPQKTSTYPRQFQRYL